MPQEHHHNIGPARRVLSTANQSQQTYHHQKTQPHGTANTLYANGLDKLPSAGDAEFWIRKARTLEESGQQKEAQNVLMEALQRDAQPITSIAKALHELQKKIESELPVDRFTVKEVTDAQATVIPNDPSTDDVESTAPLATSKAPTPRSIGITGSALRVPSRLAKTPGAAAHAVAPPATNFKVILKKLEFSTDRKPETTTKRLHFGDGVKDSSSSVTPAVVASTGFGRVLLKPSTGQRRVSFVASTISPSTNRPKRVDFANVQTPCVIAEGDGEGEQDGAQTANSENAGATPFDRRLSSLFAKYQLLEDMEEEEEKVNEEGGAQSAWTKLVASSPVNESIKALASIKPLDVDNKDQEVDTENKKEASPNTAVAAVLGELLRRSLADIQATKEQKHQATPPRPTFSGVISPRVGILSSPAPPGSNINTELSGSNLTPMSIDGVARSPLGIPLVTPNTVTTKRGKAAASIENDNDGIPADLFRTFTTPNEDKGMEALDDATDNGFTFDRATPATAAPDEEKDTKKESSREDTPDFAPMGSSKKPSSTVASKSTPPRVPRPQSLGKISVLGEAQRVLSPLPAADSSTPATSITKELRSLMQDIDLSKSPTPTPSRRYSTRSATKAAAENTDGCASETTRRNVSQSKTLKLSPTEENIRSSLRRSRRKSTTTERK